MKLMNKNQLKCDL